MTDTIPHAGAVRLEREGSIAIVVIDNPPINAGSIAVRRGLLEAVRAVGEDAQIEAAVLMGAGRTFVAGADLREFGKPLEDPQMPGVIAAIEGCEKPFVAALHGAALGGGFELALGCDARVALAGTLVGLPEVTLGIIPGAGGTQRVPRLVGPAKAIDLICSGRRIEAREALAMGLVDAVVEPDLRAQAIARAQEMRGRKRRLIELPVPPDSEEAIAAAKTAALKAGRNRPHVKEAVAAVLAATELPAAEGLAAERAAFQRLRVSTEASALRHLFFAEREAAKVAGLEAVKPRTVARIGVIGAGTMGTGIAISALDAGYDVTLVEQNGSALERGVARLREHYEGRASAGKMSQGDAESRLARLAPTLEYGPLASADLAIEAVFEDATVKQEVFRQLDAVMKPGAVLASNTSYLDLDAIAGATSRPGDVLGLHFFSPANVMRLLEVVSAAHTAPDTLATGLAVAKRLGKLAVVAKNSFGFIGNRIYAAYRRQSEFMLEEGAWPEQVDAAMEAFGYAMGPFAVGDLSGLDIAWRMRQQQAATRDPRARYVEIPDRLCESGRLGRKTGAGYYRYPPKARRGEPDPAVHALITAASADKGIARREFTAAEIQRRLLITMANEAALVIAEGVAERPSDIDLVLVNGYGFPKWEGGPVFWMRRQDPAQLAAELDRIAAVSGFGFRKGDLDVLRDPAEGTT